MDGNRPQTLDEALQVINEAMRAQGAGLKELLNSDYSNLRAAFDDLAPRVSQQLHETAAPYVGMAREVAGPQIDFAVAGSKTIATEFDRQIKRNPYLVLGGVVAGAIALGYLFGKTRTTSSESQDFTGLTYGDVQPADNVELA